MLGQIGSGWDMLAHVAGVPDAEAVEQWQAGQDPNYPVHSTSKQAVILYSKRLAGPAWTMNGVRINTVSPGPVEHRVNAGFVNSMIAGAPIQL